MAHLLKTTFCGAGEFLFLNEELSDVSIVVSSSGFPWRFPAHSLLLSAQSVVFRCMLNSDFAESKSREIVIEDASPTTIERLLRYMYYGKVDLENWKEAIDLLKAAHKYEIEPLVQKCGKFLENVITLSNVCYIYNEATTYALIALKEKCIRLILDAGFVVLRSKTFELLSKEAVLEIVTNSNLNVDSELTVFEALLRWAPIQCCRTGKEVTENNILLELQPFLQHVCFDDMSDTDKSALPTSILSCVKPSNRNRIGFSVLETLLPHTNRLHFTIDLGIFAVIGSFMNCITFSVDSSIYMIGLSFVMMANDIPSRFPLVLVKENVGSTNIFTFNLTSASWKEGIRINEKKHYETEIMLRQPVLLEDNTVYKMFCGDRGPNAQCFKTQLVNQTLHTASGHVHVSVHSEDSWSITSLIFI